MAPPFVIFALPRSRTAWLSRFLTYKDVCCGHDESRYMRDLFDLRTWFSQDNTGTVETGSAPWWRLVQKYRPDAKIAVVRRPVAEVVASLMAIDLHGESSFDRETLIAKMKWLDAKLDQIEHRIPGVLSVRYDELETGDGCAKVFEHCLPYRHDAARWRSLAAVNVQCSMPGMVRYARAFRLQLNKMADLATNEIKTSVALRPPGERGAVEIRQEPFGKFLKDGKSLFAEHSSAVGEESDSFLKKNIPQMRLLERTGALQVRTARSNGRMFGYLMTIISPSLEEEGRSTAIHTAFFASNDFPGLGLKLQRAALRDLKSQGIDEVFMRAGPRGSGPKMGSLYRRIGAAPDGELFRLDLRDA